MPTHDINTTNRETVEMLAEGYRRLDLAAEDVEKQVYPKRTEAGKIAQETAGICSEAFV